MTALETFLRALRETKASDQATPENSYLPHLKPLLEAALEGVTPKLTVLTHPKKVSGAGLADSGLVESGSNDLTSAVEAEAPTTSLEFPATTPDPPHSGLARDDRTVGRELSRAGLNPLLIRAPKECIDDVITHELVPFTCTISVSFTRFSRGASRTGGRFVPSSTRWWNCRI
jgi:hypothetical protein